VRIVSVESGIGWLPFALEAIDYQFVEAGGPRSRPEFDRLPSEYLHGQVFVTCWFERYAVRELVGKVIPADAVLFETDFPHPTSLHGNIPEQLGEMFDGVDDGVRQQILWDNAAALYGIEEPVAAAAPGRSRSEA
jgi:predicted TIM-barrel fold metal-dependent hydrolase